MANIPQYSIKLIELLDETTPRPKFPETAQQIALLDESVIRQGCYLAGRRAIVDELIQALQEDNTDADDSNEEPAGEGSLGGVILGADGEERETLASAYMAARSIDEDDSDGSDGSGAGGDQG